MQNLHISTGIVTPFEARTWSTNVSIWASSPMVRFCHFCPYLQINLNTWETLRIESESTLPGG